MSLFGGVTLPGKPDLANVARLDRLPIPMIRRMQRYGIAIDIPYFNELSSRFGQNMRELEKDIASYIPRELLYQFIGQSEQVESAEQARIDAEQAESGAVERMSSLPEFNANSAEQIAKLLFEMLGVGGGRQLKTTAGGQRISTGKKQLEMLKGEHPVIPLVLKFREYAKLKNTYTDTLPKIARLHPRGDCPVCELYHADPTHRVHTEIPTTRAATGRLASRNPNLMNIPGRTEEGQAVRAGFIAGKGKKLVSRDFSQIELRDAAHCANAASMIEVYEQGKDIHIFTACRAFNVSYAKYAGLAVKKDLGTLTEAEAKDFKDFSLNKRLPSKNVNFMIFYGAMAKGLQAQLALSGVLWSEEECESFIEQWFDLYPEVRDYIETQEYRARRYGIVWDLVGRIRPVPEAQSTLVWIRSAGFRQGGNLPIQSIAAAQMKLAMGELEPRLVRRYEDGGEWVWPILPIHDQLIVEADEEVAGSVDQEMEGVFDQVMVGKQSGFDYWRCPIKSDSEVLDRWVKG